jgi:cytochrome c-type biogenesis protein CcmH
LQPASESAPGFAGPAVRADAPTAAVRARVEALSDRIICYCGCGNKVVQRCYCGTADSLRDELRAQVEAGASDEQTLGWFVRKYGEQILAAPTPHGFNLAAWAAPSGALLAGLALAALLLWRWGRRTRAEAGSAPAAPPPSPAAEDPYEKAFEADYASRRD